MFHVSGRETEGALSRAASIWCQGHNGVVAHNLSVNCIKVLKLYSGGFLERLPIPPQRNLVTMLCSLYAHSW